MRQIRNGTASRTADLRGTMLQPAALRRTLLMTSALGFAVAACDGATTTPETDPAFHREIKAAAAPTPSNAAVFGFEVSGAWSTTSGATLTQSTTHSEGTASLSVRPGSNGYIPLASIALSTLATVSPTLAVDVMLPRTLPNPNWYGAVQIYLNCPSRAIYSQFLGQVELTGKPREIWNTLNFPVNNTIITGLLRAGYSDLVITLVLNIPTPNAGTYFVDNLRFLPVAARGCTGLPNGTACNDGNACTTGDVCQNNACVPKGTVACAAPDQCHTAGTCNPSTGTCQYPTKADGSVCDDGNACTQADTCQAGTCKAGSPVLCTASDQCHSAGMCDPQTGVCSNPSKPEGTACDDGSVCTLGDTCKSGMCTGGSPLNCDDGLTCTVDTCDPKAGCVHTGTCPRVCGTIAGLVCPAGQFCALDPGTCHATDAAGLCQPLPTVCPTIYDPVCGCDGRTYANACVANMAGAAVDHTGTCERACGGIAGISCPAGDFCLFDVGTSHVADIAGVCHTIPEACPTLYDPVCGCDGQTYANACVANVAGAAIDHTGTCDRACGGIAGLACPTGEFCAIKDGMCQVSDAGGVCKAFPTVCLDLYSPVCGCDGKTYSSACDAATRGVNVDHTGACVQICGTIAGLTCPSGQYCAIPKGGCQAMDAAGECSPLPDNCPDLVAPVCGCDGKTYSNECEAARVGVSVVKDGECVTTCGGIAGKTCPTGMYCSLSEGACNISDATGMCKSVPAVCTAEYVPVCGCDGQTYANACEANRNGVSVASTGVCPGHI